MNEAFKPGGPLNEWMRTQEAINQEIAARLNAIDAALFSLMQFVGLIDNSPPTDEEEQWAAQVAAEGR